jgi:hypothetical protein
VRIVREAQCHVERSARLHACHRRHQLDLDRTFAHGRGVKDAQAEQKRGEGAEGCRKLHEEGD